MFNPSTNASCVSAPSVDFGIQPLKVAPVKTFSGDDCHPNLSQNARQKSLSTLTMKFHPIEINSDSDGESSDRKR